MTRERGLGDWSSADLVTYLKTGHNRFAGASGPMAEEVVHSSSKMTDSDLSAIATYLESKPAGIGSFRQASRPPRIP